MDWISAESNKDGTVKIPERWLHLYYYEAFNMLFRFENALRLFVYVVLKHNIGKDWDLAIIGENVTIRTETKKRIRQAREHGYLGYDVSSPMLFLNSGELTQIISSEKYWKYFAPFLRQAKVLLSLNFRKLVRFVMLWLIFGLLRKMTLIWLNKIQSIYSYLWKHVLCK